jgi:hypothetical protein
MPPEKHISVPKEELRLALKNRLELSDRSQFDDLVKLMECVASFDFVDLRQRMRSNFLPFGSGAHNQAYLAGLGRELTAEELDTKVRLCWVGRAGSAHGACMRSGACGPVPTHTGGAVRRGGRSGLEGAPAGCVG